MMFKNILLGVDGSAHALKAAKVAGELTRTMGANLRIVTAYDPVPDYLGEPNLLDTIAARQKHADEILRAALKEVGPTPNEVKTEMLEGSAAEVIIEVANTRQVDLIVVGSRGLGQLVGLLLGSQSQKIIQHAPCPVLVVR
ncbi:MAG: universal stress protein [Candidatus Villigracilaceae bacterium]